MNMHVTRTGRFSQYGNPPSAGNLKSEIRNPKIGWFEFRFSNFGFPAEGGSQGSIRHGNYY